MPAGLTAAQQVVHELNEGVQVDGADHPDQAHRHLPSHWRVLDVGLGRSDHEPDEEQSLDHGEQPAGPDGQSVGQAQIEEERGEDDGLRRPEWVALVGEGAYGLGLSAGRLGLAEGGVGLAPAAGFPLRFIDVGHVIQWMMATRAAGGGGRRPDRTRYGALVYWRS